MTNRDARPGIAVAPMMDWTDRHCRYLMRLLSPSVRLYTEMVTAQAIRHGNREQLLAFDETEHPVALQLGGSDPVMMTEAAVAGARRGYDEVNINVGCPSDRVQSGRFGACLMATPEVVAACASEMSTAVDVPVTVKTRIGIDNIEDYGFLLEFVDTVAETGCTTFIIHARKAILSGLSPKENRTVPPLKYERVYRIKQDRPDLQIVMNGGITTIEECRRHLAEVDGVMIGRQAYHRPWFLTELEEAFGTGETFASRVDIVDAMVPYIDREVASGTPLKRIARHLLGLFSGEPGARQWRRFLSENAHRCDREAGGVSRILATLPQLARQLQGTVR